MHPCFYSIEKLSLLGNACLPPRTESWELGNLICRFSSGDNWHREHFPARTFGLWGSALRGTSRKNPFENTHKNPNTLAVCSQEPPRKIEFTLKATTATEPLEVSQLFWSANLIIQHFMHCVHALSKERSIIEGCFSLGCVCDLV